MASISPLTSTTAPSGPDTSSPTAPSKGTVTPPTGLPASDGWGGVRDPGTVRMGVGLDSVSAPLPPSAPPSQLWGAGSDPAQASAVGPAGSSRSDPVVALDRALQGFDDAKDASDQLSQEISAELSQLGPALTTEDRQAFIQSFQGDQDRATSALSSSSDTLSDALNTLLKSSPDAYKNPDVAQMMFDAYDRLAASPAHAAQVFAWTQTLHDGVRAAFAQAVGDLYSSRLKSMISTAISSVAKAALVDSQGDIGAAVRQFCGTLDTLSQVKDLSDLKDVPDLLQGVGTLAQDSTVDPAEYIKEHWSSLSEVGKSIAGTSLSLYLMKAGKEALKGNFVSAIRELVKADGDQDIPLVATQVLSYGASSGLAAAVPGMGMASTLLSITLREAQAGRDLVTSGFEALGDAAAAAAKVADKSGHTRELDHMVGVVTGAISTLPHLLSSLAGGSRLEDGIQRMGSLPGLSDLAFLVGSVVRDGFDLGAGRVTARELQDIAREVMLSTFGQRSRMWMGGQKSDRERDQREREELQRLQAVAAEKFRAQVTEAARRAEARGRLLDQPA